MPGFVTLSPEVQKRRQHKLFLGFAGVNVMPTPQKFGGLGWLLGHLPLCRNSFTISGVALL
jgi:hypothetical protein